MAMILITDNPQGVECRCEGQELDLANLSPEQVEALKQALGISETAGTGATLDLANLNPEQVEALKSMFAPDLDTIMRMGVNEMLKSNLDLYEVYGPEMHMVEFLFQSAPGRPMSLASAFVTLANVVRSVQDILSKVSGYENMFERVYDLESKVAQLESNPS